jgi:hypothetical protein
VALILCATGTLTDLEMKQVWERSKALPHSTTSTTAAS